MVFIYNSLHIANRKQNWVRAAPLSLFIKGRGEIYIPNNVPVAPNVGGTFPKWAYAFSVASRPRGVRFRNPSWIKKGSYTSSKVPASSPTEVAMVVMLLSQKKPEYWNCEFLWQWVPAGGEAMTTE